MGSSEDYNVWIKDQALVTLGVDNAISIDAAVHGQRKKR
jgi:hypothetical protein